MRAIRLIARREWVSIICSPTGLVVMGLYLLLAGYIFSLNISLTQEANLRYMFQSLGTITILVVPLITMRLLSEELRTGTFEVLTSHPVTDVEIILGKFVAGWMAFLMLSAPTLSYLVILQVLGSPDWGPALCGYLGQQLLAAMLIALGLVISALTSSQALAAMGALIGGVLLALAGTAAYSVQGWLGDALAYLAVFEHYSLFRRGVLDSRALVYFAATTAMFLYLAVRAVESRRWKFGAVPGRVPGKWLHPWLSIGLAAAALLLLVEVIVSRITGSLWSWFQTFLVVLIFALLGVPLWLNRFRVRYELGQRQMGIALTVVVNSILVISIWALATFMSARHYVRLDLTSSKHYALSEQTRRVLQQLSVPVDVVIALPRPGDLRQEIEDLLAEYKARSSRLSVRYIDPVRSPGELEEIREKYKLTSALSDEILVAIGDHARRVPVASLISQRVAVVNGQMVPGPVQFVGEAEITSTLIQLTRKTPGRVMFLYGHGEKMPDDSSNNGALAAATELHRNGWLVDKYIITPGANAQFAPDTSVVVLAGPRKELSNEDLKALQGVLDRGGGVLALVDPGVNAGLEPLLDAWGAHLNEDLVVDLQDHLASADPTSLYVTRFSQEHAIGKGMGALAAVLPMSRRIAISAASPPGVFVHSFMHTSGNGWAIQQQPGMQDQHLQIDKNRDKRGPISLGVACERSEQFAQPGEASKQGRLVVIGNSSFITSQYVDMAGNLNLFLNCVDWLAGRQDLISVRPKVVDVRFMDLTRAQTQAVSWISVLIIPALAVVIGIVALRRRRQRA